MAESLPGYRRGSSRHLNCSLCHEVFRSPRLLPCFHTFCLDCLEGLIRHHRGVFPCPQCRKPTPIPRNGALGFQLNFYIQEEDLEMERNGPGTSLCPNHKEDPLLFFCVPCDRPICWRCKLTQHDHHETQDLSEAATHFHGNLKASKDRLEVAINHLTEVVNDAQGNLNNANEKEKALVEEVTAQACAIVTRVNKCRDKVVEDIKQCNQSINSQLKQDAQNAQQKLDGLLQLRQRVNHALSGASDAEKVRVEKEMRQGEGSEDELNKVKEYVPATTFRPGLHRDHSLFNDDTIHQWLGSAVPLSLPFAAAVKKEIIFRIYQCGPDQSYRQVHTICYINKDCIYISSGGTTPDYAEAEKGCITDLGVQQWFEPHGQGKVYFLKINKEIFYLDSGERSCDETIKLGSKGSKDISVAHVKTDECCTVYTYNTTSKNPILPKPKTWFSVKCGKPTAFDVTRDKQLFVILEENTNEDSMKTNLNILLFRREESQPFTTYTPSDLHFHPADVCFWQDKDQIKLLVADTNNDSVHVVRIEGNSCCFERYLAPGSNKLVRPTALEVDDQGHVWIGCSNGWILKCEKHEYKRVTENMRLALFHIQKIKAGPLKKIFQGHAVSAIVWPEDSSLL